jgi:hypothetical protein
MAKKKSKDLLLAEIAFAAGRAAMFSSDDDMDVMYGPEIAFKKWKEQTGGRAHVPYVIDKALEKWIAAGSPKEGIFYGDVIINGERIGGQWYVFSPDGEYLLSASFDKNIGTAR